MNQITENIACNNEYYNVILEANLRNNKFYRLLHNIRNNINYSIQNSGPHPPIDGIVNAPIFNTNAIIQYFNIIFFDKPIYIYVKENKAKCNSFVLEVRLEANHDIVVNSNEYTDNSKSEKDNKQRKIILYQGWPVFIINRVKNTPTQGKDTVTIQYSQNIFHFTFHSTKSKLEKNNVCVSEDWEHKSRGAFHMILDCCDTNKRKNPRTPLVELESNQKPYIPFVYDTSNNRFLTLPAIIGKPENNLYTTRITNDSASNMCHNDYSKDLWYMATNGKPFYFMDSSGNRKDYIKEVINPMFNYIVGQINHSMRLPSGHSLSLDRPDIFGKHPLPTPVACDKIPTPRDIIRCSSNPLYNEVVNNSNLEQLQQREHERKTTKTGGNKRTTVKKKSMRGRGRTISKN
jgi:hypothetical protein